jgi:acetamidase/formamidase
VAQHEIPLERRTLHGHFSRDLPPILTVDSGDSVAFACLNAGWRDGRNELFAERRPRGAKLDAGHALIGPIGVRGARAGDTLVVQIDEVRVAQGGFTQAGGWFTPLNRQLGVASGETVTLEWELDADAGVGRDGSGREVVLRPFLGVIGMPPAEPGIHSTGPPRPNGGNIDCKELVAGTTLYLPVAVDGALLSAGDGHAAQGDGEVSQLAIEAAIERAQVTISVRDDLPLTMPIAWTPDTWIAFGFHKDLDRAAAIAVDGMLDLMTRELGLGRREALAYASVVVDLRITQMVNGVRGVHARLAHDALRTTTMS